MKRQLETRLQRAQREVIRSEALLARQERVVADLLGRRATEDTLANALHILKAFQQHLAFARKHLEAELADAERDGSA